jgi:hypothetical protein
MSQLPFYVGEYEYSKLLEYMPRYSIDSSTATKDDYNILRSRINEHTQMNVPLLSTIHRLMDQDNMDLLEEVIRIIHDKKNVVTQIVFAMTWRILRSRCNAVQWSVIISCTTDLDFEGWYDNRECRLALTSLMNREYEYTYVMEKGGKDVAMVLSYPTGPW